MVGRFATDVIPEDPSSLFGDRISDAVRGIEVDDFATGLQPGSTRLRTGQSTSCCRYAILAQHGHDYRFRALSDRAAQGRGS